MKKGLISKTVLWNYTVCFDSNEARLIQYG